MEQKFVSNEASEAGSESRMKDLAFEEERASKSKEMKTHEEEDDESSDEESEEEEASETMDELGDDEEEEEEDEESDEDEKWVLEMNNASESVEANRRVETNEKSGVKEANSKTSKATGEFAGFSDDDDDVSSSEDENLRHAPSAARGIEVSSGPDRGDDTSPEEAAASSMSDGQLHDNLASEANQSLSILSSLLGRIEPSTTPLVASGAAHRNEEAEDASTFTSPPPPKKASSKFAVTERFRGQEEVSMPALGETNASKEVHQDEEPPSLSASADLMSLKSIFHGEWASKPPEFGFAPHEDPATLSGFKSMAERVTATQGHSFAFSFQPIDDNNDEAKPTTITAPSEDTVNNEVRESLNFDGIHMVFFFRLMSNFLAFCFLDHLKLYLSVLLFQVSALAIQQELAAPAPAVISLPLWGGYSQMTEEARAFLETPASVPNWKEQRRFVMQDTKRKYRTFVHGAAALKTGHQKASKISQ
jgi:hypothetical protein